MENVSTDPKRAARAYQVLIFFGSFLLFSVQPIVGKFILPWFGGSPSVWITAMLFFQVLLLVGYAYAYLLSRFALLGQAIGFCAVLILAVATLPITPSGGWQPEAIANPTLHILLLLAATVGLPYAILASVSPVLQVWARSTDTAWSPYRLYAWSNAGSLAGLWTYPLIIEPLLSVQQQTYLWSVLFGVFSLAAVAVAIRRYRAKTDPALQAETKQETSVSKPRATDRVLWVALPFAGSLMLLAVTNFITQDVASIPLLWVVPLGIYLLSFILTFDNEHFYDRRFFASLVLYVGIIGTFLILLAGSIMNMLVLTASLLLLAVYTIVCHGELYALRPHPRYLTSFYLWLSAGGALGGVFVALIAPRIFPLYFELHLGIGLTLVIMLLLWTKRRLWTPLPRSPLLGKVAVGAAALIILSGLSWNVRERLSAPTYVYRDFFGSLRIIESENHKALYHGRVLHGIQMKSEGLVCWPTTYYGQTSGLGRAISALETDREIRLGVVGLGVGTAAAYGHDVRFYELNPKVAEIARTKFRYLSDCGAETEIVLGDGRLSLERETSQHFDLLALDAFNSDAIPIHLLTEEAFSVYLRHLADGGVIAVHISNDYIDFKPVIGGLAERFDLAATIVQDSGENNKGTSASTWALLTADETFFARAPLAEVLDSDAATFDRLVHWTDKYSNLVSVFRFR
ncbi:MAG: fused MFS/spermidine synthase [Patescibacteria group bacterium]